MLPPARYSAASAVLSVAAFLFIESHALPVDSAHGNDEHIMCSEHPEARHVSGPQRVLLQVGAATTFERPIPASANAAAKQVEPEAVKQVIEAVKHEAHPHRVPGSDLQNLTVTLDPAGYSAIVEVASDTHMAVFIQRLVDQLGGVIVDQAKFKKFVPWYSGRVDKQSFTKLLKELRAVAHGEDGWIKMPPPEQGPVLWKMIRSDPWVCDLIIVFDSRLDTCALEPNADSLQPRLLSCGEKDTCNVEHANAFRSLYQSGPLPCCSTPPFCSAPSCSQQPVESAPRCTKRTPAEYVAYMKQPDTWPAYHGYGGSFELDTSKYLDLLACHPSDDSCTGTYPFDLVLDLGANTGYYTEKFTVRKFAKNYIMIDAKPGAVDVLRERWGDVDWKKRWFTEQVKQRDGSSFPDFEIVGSALSNHSDGVVNMCSTEMAMPDGCEVDVNSVDHLLLTSNKSKNKSPLDSALVNRVRQAQSAFIKIDTEGMDELVLRGMQGLLNETRGKHKDNSTRYLVNFLQYEFSPELMKIVKGRDHIAAYDIKTVTKFLESIGFESFMIGPRFLPLSHGSWHDEYKMHTSDAGNNPGVRLNYPDFDDRICGRCGQEDKPSFTSDVFAIRKSHPLATQLKVALGACKESVDFDIKDPQYSFAA